MLDTTHPQTTAVRGASISGRLLAQRHQAIAALFSLVMVGLVLSPMAESWKAAPQDNFPLSYYPMFTKKRSGHVRLSYLVGITADGDEIPLHYKFAGRGGMNLVRKQILQTIRSGRTAELCHKVARRVARSTRRPIQDVALVAIVTGTFRSDEYFAGQTRPYLLTIEAVEWVKR